MCGFCGIVRLGDAPGADEAGLIAMRDAMFHRGPDDGGHYIAPGIALGSRRLAILDLSERGHMPMSSTDGRYWIAYNGEVYNFRSLRPELEAKGYVFRSDSDTEVLLNLYVEYGPAMLDRLNGMFGFAVWDARERTLFIGRDRLGIKPIYYAWHEGGLYFASEEKALFAAGIPARFDSSHWEELLCFRYVAGEQTPFAGVRRLRAGHWMKWKDGKTEIRRWWNLSEKARQHRERSPADAVTWYRETFDDAVQLRQISDVPVGVLLSGGLDSSTVGASLGQKGKSGLASFTVRFDETGFDEGPLAREVADRWGLEFHEQTLSLDNLMEQVRRASWFNDEPLAHVNHGHLLLISEYAKPWVTVLLSGEGADEVMGGYVRYRPLYWPKLLNLARPILPPLTRMFGTPRRVEKLGRFLGLGSLDAQILMNSCDTLPADLETIGMKPTRRYAFREEILAEAKALFPGEAVRQVMYCDQHAFLCSLLDRNDRMTMGASIECRVPFLDYRLVEGLAGLSSDVMLTPRESKHLLRKSLGSRLPKAILEHRKWGFGVPWHNYLRERPDFRQLVEDLPTLEPICDGPFDRAKLTSVVRAFLVGDNRQHALVLQLVLMAIWYDVCVRGATSGLAMARQSSARGIRTSEVEPTRG